ncbi:MAG: DUF1292 domain-containing protein [Bacilli bacterium]
MENKNIIKFRNDKGKELACRILFTVEDEKSKKNYIIYTSDEKEKDGKIKTYASRYKENEDGDIYDLIPIKTDKEWDFISKILNSLQKEEEKNDKKEV